MHSIFMQKKINYFTYLSRCIQFSCSVFSSVFMMVNGQNPGGQNPGGQDPGENGVLGQNPRVDFQGGGQNPREIKKLF